MNAPAPGRIAAIDVARGMALAGMGGYHLTWDLAFFGLIAANAPYTWQMRAVSHVVASAFLALAGISLALAHRAGPNWRGFGQRLGMIVVAAAAVSVVTWFTAPETPILFGILHCLAAASLLAAPLLRAPAWAALAAGALAIIAPVALANPAFNPAWLLWLGLGTLEPATLDWQPLLPWAGVTLLGLGAAKLYLSWLVPSSIPRGTRPLAFAGRHSLAIYLIHQPVLFGLLYAGTQVTGFSERMEVKGYLTACRPACVEAGGDMEACDKACACVAHRASGEGLTASLRSRAATEADRGRVTAIVAACGDEAR